MVELFDLIMEENDGAPVEFLPAAPKAETETEKALSSFKRQREKETAAEKAARDAKRAARMEKNAARVESYDFTGKTIPGKGYYIYFDGDSQKTRIIFEKAPAEKVKEAIKAAGFWYNGAMKSWNRRLNKKTYKAALELSVLLAAYTE